MSVVGLSRFLNGSQLFGVLRSLSGSYVGFFAVLTVHFIYCKETLYSIATVTGKPLRVDHVTASVNFIDRVLIEYIVLRPLFPTFGLVRVISNFGRMLFFSRLLPIVLPVNALVILQTVFM